MARTVNAKTLGVLSGDSYFEGYIFLNMWFLIFFQQSDP
jgi:hypothetical protein